jgi:hypothetical protein
MDFNFSNIGETNFSSNAGAYLRPYDIYEVNLTKIEKTVLKSKDGTEYPVVTVEFTGCGDNKGTFTANLFIPRTEKDMERPVFKNNEGHEYNRPSSFENFQYTLMQIVHALNPTGEQKIKENASKIKTIDQFIDLIIKAVSGKNNVKTNLKLVGRVNNGTTYAALPSACGLTKTGEIFPTNFIGENLFFSNYELTQQKAYKNAKPTDMTKVENNPDENQEENDIDLDGIEL